MGRGAALSLTPKGCHGEGEPVAIRVATVRHAKLLSRCWIACRGLV